MKSRRENETPVFRVQQMKRIDSPKRMQWDTDFDAHLTYLVEHTKHKGWKEISRAMTLKFPNILFTPKKCRARWKNSVDPSLCRLNLSNAEELISLAYHYSYKNQWSTIAQYLPHRHNNILRNNFHGLIRKLIGKVSSDKFLSSKITPLFLLQTLYTAIYIEELLDLKEAPSEKNKLVPLYIYLYINESSVRKSKLREYVLKTRNSFVELHKSYSKLHLLLKLSYEELAGEFLKIVITKIKKNVTTQMKILDAFILELLEDALSLYFSSKPTPITPIMEPAPFTQSFCGVNYIQFYPSGGTGNVRPSLFHPFSSPVSISCPRFTALGGPIPMFFSQLIPYNHC